MIAIGEFHIHPIQLEDAWSVCDFATSNEDRLKQYFPETLEQNLTPTLSKNFVEKKVNQFSSEEELLFTIKHGSSSELVGLVYIKELDKKMKQAEFAYAIGYPFEGKGIITKAVKALSEYAFETLKLKKLQIIVHENNKGSIKVALNCGYTWVKKMPNEFTPANGTPLDMELYELTNER